MMLGKTLSGLLIAICMFSSHLVADDKLPLTIAASDIGDFSQGGSWYLSVNSAGQAELTIEPGLRQPKRIFRQFTLTDKQLAEFRNALEKVSFFDLAAKYGQHVPDGSTQSLTVIHGDRVHSVEVRFLMNWLPSKHDGSDRSEKPQSILSGAIS